jgi:hypothetical protein
MRGTWKSKKLAANKLGKWPITAHITRNVRKQNKRGRKSKSFLVCTRFILILPIDPDWTLSSP